MPRRALGASRAAPWTSAVIYSTSTHELLPKRSPNPSRSIFDPLISLATAVPDPSTSMCRMPKHALPTDESEQRASKRPSSGDEAMSYRPVRRPQKNNEWWSVSENYFAAMDHDTQVKWSHIGRIMETAQGRQMEAPCERCRENGTECWAYTEDAAKRLDDAGFGCAECRLRQDWQESCTLNVRWPSSPVSRIHR
ncbi:uncharacterized protein IWZ02DRAFT_102911 [Phyllosticta citriasiana]|uniref:uncharacterized protein n=1 Tax=Phyllosticta citriasiana TaxID=595635 RepID=UPI0030FD24BB